MHKEDYSPFRKQVNKKGHFVFGMNEKNTDSKNKDRLIVYHDFLWKINYSNGIFLKASRK